MKRFFFFLACVTLVTAACSRKSDTGKDSYEYFQGKLKADMNYPNIVSSFGAPDADAGSGIHIYVYNLADGTFIKIGFTDRIVYARHVDGAGHILHTLF